jgi:ferric-dicitrate binding protein FerR (iron transport regulator)
MKNLSRAGGLFALTIVLVAASAAMGQNRERFGISAKAGGVNAVVGRVMVERKDQASQLVTNRDDLATGDTVTTGFSSHAEILLNPGTYLRVGEDSEFQFVDDSLENLRIKLIRGSVVVEVTGVDDMDMNINIETEQAKFTLMRSGVYRVDAQPDLAAMAVKKGRARFGPDRDQVVKGGNRVVFRKGYMERAKLAKDQDELDGWSRQRAVMLARANDRLPPNVFNSYISSTSIWDRASWGNGFGIWTFSPRLGFYTFMPFRYGWTSPYGHNYGSYCPYYGWRGGSNGGGSIVSNQNSGPGIISGGTSTGGGSTSGGGLTSGGGSTIGPSPSGMGSSPPARIERSIESSGPSSNHRVREP